MGKRERGNGKLKRREREQVNGKGNDEVFPGIAIHDTQVAERLIRDYRDLLAWQKAIELAVMADKIADALPRKAWNLASQIRRAADSVHSNIAEGNGRFSRADYLRHVSMSNASLRELESKLHFIQRRYGPARATEAALDHATVVAKLIAGLVRSLRKGRE